MAELTGMTEHADHRLPGLPIHYLSNHHPSPDSMVVLMPAALTATREDRAARVYPRWSWHIEWPTSLVLAISDPALQQSLELSCTWFIHPELDVVAAVAGFIADTADAAGIPAERIVFFGSSLGGFGAIACASHLQGARAVAEVPQIDFERWQANVTRRVEKYVTQGPIAEFRAEHPERISLYDRLRFAGLVPPIQMISNATDRTIADQQEFIAWCQSVDLPRMGEQTLEVTDTVEGHAALPRREAVPRVAP